MNRFAFFKGAALRLLAALFILSSLLTTGPTNRLAQAAVSRVAYVYGSDISISANAFNTFLTGRGITVDVYSDLQAVTADFTPDQVILISDDIDVTGGFAALTHIENSGKPVVAIGQWGSIFFSLVAPPVVTAGTGFITTGSDYRVHVADPYAPIWSQPSTVTQINQIVPLYTTAAISAYALSIPAPVQAANRIGRLPGDPNHYSLFSTLRGASCYSYWGYRGLPALLNSSGTNLFLNMLFGSPCTAGAYAVNSILANTPPVMDGVFNYGEWIQTPNLLEMDHGFAAVMNDAIRMYLIVDVPESVINNTGVPENDFWVTFDTNNDGAISPGVDVNYALESGTHNMRYRHYVNPAQWELLPSPTKSSLGPGFDCYTPDNTKILNIVTQKFDCSPHQLWEIAIDLKEINAVPGQVIHMGLRTQTPNPNFTDEMPNSFDVDFSNLISVHLASIPIPVHDPAANLAFVTPAVEITQVVQNVTNSIPLVANKTTAGRVSVISTNTSFPQPVLEYLYGQRGSADLPGSPLVQQINAPLTVSRANLADTANFLLPPSWTTLGEVTFHGEASDFNNHSVASSPQLLTFQSKAVPVYWMIQENMGTTNALQLVPQADIDKMESYIKATFPVPDVTFVQRPWTVVGALNGASPQNNVNGVAYYYNTIAAVYWNAIMQLKPAPYALPEMIFGAANAGGGISDPTWYNNGAGHAAIGSLDASSREGVAAHEFNHNLDRSATGTWGRHVNACGTTGPDPNWPNVPQTDPSISEYGFDTRLPWLNTNASKTVIPTDTPDLMSYCQSGYMSPTKWISPYRYQAWFGSALFPAAPTASPVNSLYITGSLNSNGTGSLNPVLAGGGMPISPAPAGVYSVQLSGVGIPTVTHFFNAVFQDVEGNPQPVVPFNFALADPGGVATITLLHGTQVLATLNKAAVPPSAAFTAPAAGALSGTVTVSWNLTPGSVPAAGLNQQLQFSANGGSTWIPVTGVLPGTVSTYSLDTGLLPQTAAGRLRLWISDGLNNVSVDLGTFSVGNHAPMANILAPLNLGFISGGSQVLLQGQASDVDESNLPDNNFVWKLDGSTVLGGGRNVQLVLPNGQHTLSLTVVDSGGLTGTASVTVFVNDYRVLIPLIRR